MTKVVVGLAVGALALAACSSSDNQRTTESTRAAQAQASTAAAAHAAAVAKANAAAKAKAHRQAVARAAHAKAVRHAQVLARAKAAAHAKDASRVKAQAVAGTQAGRAATKPNVDPNAGPNAEALAMAKKDPKLHCHPGDEMLKTGCWDPGWPQRKYYFTHPGQPYPTVTPPTSCNPGKKWDTATQSCLPISLLERARTNNITPAEGSLITKCNNGTYSPSSSKCAGVPHPGFD